MLERLTLRGQLAQGLTDGHAVAQKQTQVIQLAAQRHVAAIGAANRKRSAEVERLSRAFAHAFQDSVTSGGLANAWRDYLIDASQRAVLTLDTLRKRGDIFIEHEAAGAPPVLAYHYRVVVDGETLPRPCNYMLLQILPPDDVEVYDWKRPYVIIDPRAGHGPGIGGFKPDSQVGVALHDGHPVYFVAFKPLPTPNQTLACVTHAEAAFLREIKRRHPGAPKPVVVGNCQGGWATAILAATNPDLTGPIVLNGAPMSYWSGRLGQDPMRYTGGLAGGVLPAMLLSDLGGGVFDGAHLVANFETLNPGRTWFAKYYDLYANVDTAADRFLEFERWWGGLFMMNEAEIRWIIENLFVGNRLAKNEARLEVGRPIDLKQIRAPIIVFASHGDNITPPAQALNWIVDTYADETEIEIRGQRIVYMIHEEIGHLGIFVSSSVAKREHSEMASTLKTIEALAPGLYEMRIEDSEGQGKERRFTVSFTKRRMTDVLEHSGTRAEEPAFAAVARMSEALAEAYEVGARPLIKSLFPPELGDFTRAMHPMRTQRAMMASQNPLMSPVAQLADAARENRQPAPDMNPFVQLERLTARNIEIAMNMATEWRGFAAEMMFLTLYGGPLANWYGRPRQQSRTRKTAEELRGLQEVADALEGLQHGGLAEAVVRMLVLLADSRGNVRRDRLERSSVLLTQRRPFSELDRAVRTRLIHRQTLVAHFEPEAGLLALPQLLPTEDSRREALSMVEYVVGADNEMEPHTLALMERMRAMLRRGTTVAPAVVSPAAE